MKIFKISVVALCITFAIGFVITATIIIKQSMIDIMINDNVNSLAHNVKYRTPVNIEGVPVIKQEISGGYACIEMLSEYLSGGSSEITEKVLYEKNGSRISTSTNDGLLNEIKKQFPDHTVTQYKNLKNIELIDKIYDSLSNGMPVIFLFASLDITAAEDKTEDAQDFPDWSLHCGIAVGMDIPGGEIKVINPYGYAETYNPNNFLRATRFESYENMEFYLKLGFAAEIFTKNTIYILGEKTGEANEMIN